MMDQNGMTPLMWAAYRTHRFGRSGLCTSGDTSLLAANMKSFIRQTVKEQSENSDEIMSLGNI